MDTAPSNTSVCEGHASPAYGPSAQPSLLAVLLASRCPELSFPFMPEKRKVFRTLPRDESNTGPFILKIDLLRLPSSSEMTVPTMGCGVIPRCSVSTSSGDRTQAEDGPGMCVTYLLCSESPQNFVASNDNKHVLAFPVSVARGPGSSLIGWPSPGVSHEVWRLLSWDGLPGTESPTSEVAP